MRSSCGARSNARHPHPHFSRSYATRDQMYIRSDEENKTTIYCRKNHLEYDIKSFING